MKTKFSIFLVDSPDKKSWLFVNWMQTLQSEKLLFSLTSVSSASPEKQIFSGRSILSYSYFYFVLLLLSQTFNLVWFLLCLNFSFFASLITSYYCHSSRSWIFLNLVSVCISLKRFPYLSTGNRIFKKLANEVKLDYFFIIH